MTSTRLPAGVEARSYADLLDGAQGGAIAGCAAAILDLAGPLQVAERSGRILYQNPALRALLAEAGGPPSMALAPTLVAKLAWNREPLRLTETFAAQRRARTFSVRYAPLAWAGADLVVAFFEEITQSADLLRNFKRYRDRSQEFLSIVSDWVWEIDREWRLLHTVGRAGEQVFTELVGSDLLTLGSFIDLPDYPTMRPPNRRTRAPFQDRPFRLAIEGLGERIMLLSAVPVFTDEQGAFEGYRGSGRDITAQYAASESARAYQQKLEATLGELRAANDRLDQALIEVRAADQAKSSFLAMMGHELRTPLNAVIGFAELLKGEIFGPLGSTRYVDYAGDILSSGQHLLSLINDILNYVRIESGEVRLRNEPIDVSDVLSTAAQFVSEQARKGGLDLVADYAVPVLFVADERNLRQVILNLLSNAVKFTPPGGTISIEAAVDSAGLTIQVRDTGVGIPPDQLIHVLKPFQQADGRLERQFEGTGLGLPLAKALIALHGGTLALESTVGTGTLVTVFVPHPAMAAESTGA